MPVSGALPILATRSFASGASSSEIRNGSPPRGRPKGYPKSGDEIWIDAGSSIAHIGEKEFSGRLPVSA
jgi:hypothetical protein